MDNLEINKIKKSFFIWQAVFGVLCLVVVVGSIFSTVFYINTIQSAITNQDTNIAIQSSSDILNLSIPILSVFAGLVISFLGLRKFENVDEELDTNISKINSRLNKEIEEFQSIKEMVIDEIDKKISQTINDKTSNAIDNLEIVLAESETKINKLETSVLNFLQDYQWLIDNKEVLDKIITRNISELDRFVKHSLDSDNTDEVTIAIALVQKSIDENQLIGNENDFYNLATHLAQRNYTKEAVGICNMGLKLFPNNLDLLSCLTLYNAQIGDFESARIFSEKLEEIDYKTWNWRAYTFLIDYYNYLAMSKENKDKILQYVDYYKIYLPYEEKAYMAEYETYLKYGEYDKAISALKIATNTLKMTPQCAFNLADYYREIGEFDLSIEMATKTIIGNAEDQESVTTGAAFAYRGLSKDAKIHTDILNNVFLIADNRLNIIDALKDLRMSLELGFRRENIITRIKILNALLEDEPHFAMDEEDSIPTELLLEMLKRYPNNNLDNE